MAKECVLKTLFAFFDQQNYTDDDIYASLCFVRERWTDFMGDGDFVLYHNKEKNFEVGDIQGEVMNNYWPSQALAAANRGNALQQR